MHKLRWVILILLILAADQATKLWVLAALQPYEVIPVLPSLNLTVALRALHYGRYGVSGGNSQSTTNYFFGGPLTTAYQAAGDAVRLRAAGSHAGTIPPVLVDSGEPHDGMRCIEAVSSRVSRPTQRTGPGGEGRAPVMIRSARRSRGGEAPFPRRRSPLPGRGPSPRIRARSAPAAGP